MFTEIVTDTVSGQWGDLDVDEWIEHTESYFDDSFDQLYREEKHMKKRLWKIAAGICLVLAMQLLLVSCSSPAEWEGTYYSWNSNSDTARIITIEMTGADTFKATFGVATIDEGGGYGHASIGDYGETTGKNTAETNGMRFTLKGDDLKAVVLDEDYSPYVNDTEFDGTYQRGESFEDAFGNDEGDINWDGEDESVDGENDGDGDWSDDADSNDTPAETPQILIGSDFYYRSVNSESKISLNFEDGYVTIIHDDTGNLSGREYELTDGFISVTLEDGDVEDGDFAYIALLRDIQILDLCTLMDMNGNIYAVDGSQGTELETGRGYYQNADVDADSYLFWENGTCSFDSDGNTQIAGYAVDGETITITLEDGDTMTLYIINRRLLKSDDGGMFVRL